MGMLYLCSIKKQRTKHRSAMQQGVNAIAAWCVKKTGLKSYGHVFKSHLHRPIWAKHKLIALINQQIL